MIQCGIINNLSISILDGNGLQYHRARYYHPGVGVFPSLDPLEGGNRYAYVGGNVVNRVDPSGLVGELPSTFDLCWQIPVDTGANCSLCPNGVAPVHFELCASNNEIYVNEGRQAFLSWFRNVYSEMPTCCSSPNGGYQWRHLLLDELGIPDTCSHVPETLVFDCGNFPPLSSERTLCLRLMDAMRFESGTAQIHQYHTLSYVINWFNTNKASINYTSQAFGVDPALVAGILMSELIWDYNDVDRLQDVAIKAQCTVADGAVVTGNGTGIANPHEETFIEALNELREWGIANTISGYNLDEIYRPCDLITSIGSIKVAALVARWLMVYYGKEIELSPEDMATIFAGYRQGREVFDFDGFSGNARFALPIMIYTNQEYD